MRLRRIEHESAGAARPLLIAHGLFGSGRNWGVIARRLSDRGPVAAADMRNHGDSPWSETHGYPELADDLAETHDARSDILGHSMGGKAAMVLALTRPELVGKLVVADIAPVGYSHTQLPLIDAMEALDLSGIAQRSEADRRLSADVDDPGIRAFLLQSLDLKAGRWKLNLPVLRAEMDKIIGFPKIAGRFDGPTLFLTGAGSDYVKPEHRERIRVLFPAARFAKIPGAGHWLHAEKPREFEAAVRAFLDA